MAALRAAVFPLSAKNRRGGHISPPPSSARVKPQKNSVRASLVIISIIRVSLCSTEQVRGGTEHYYVYERLYNVLKLSHA